MDVAGKLSSFKEDSRRIFTVSKKPDWPEFSGMAKVIAIGVIIIAIIGFIVRLIFVLTGIGG